MSANYDMVIYSGLPVDYVIKGTIIFVRPEYLRDLFLQDRGLC